MTLSAQPKCAHKRCRRKPTQAFDVGSWFRAPYDQTLRHYEVCDKHADYFRAPFDKQQSQRVDKDLLEWKEPLSVAS